MSRLSFLRRHATVLTLAAAAPLSAHAGLTGSTVDLSFSGSGFSAVNFGSAVVGDGVEFSQTATDVFGQIWTFNVDVFDAGVRLSWTESTRAGEPNGGNISAGPDSYTFDLSFGTASVPALDLTRFESQGSFSGSSALSSVSTGAQSFHAGFSGLNSTDVYEFGDVSAVPEPETVSLLLASALIGGLVLRRSRHPQA